MATTADTEIILKLYELRREPEMRKARDYIGAEFWPESFDGLWKEIGMSGDKNRWFRQVYGYWDMAAALAIYGGMDQELFVATQAEMFYAFAKISEYVKNLREKTPDFMISITTLCRAERESTGAVGAVRGADAIVPREDRGREGEALKIGAIPCFCGINE